MTMSISDNQTHTQTIAPAAYTTTQTGATVDTGREGYARKALINAGLWVDGTFTFTFEDSPDDSTWTALDATKLNSSNALLITASVIINGLADDNQAIEVDLLSAERYVRVVGTVAGGPATGLVYGVDIVTDNLRNAGVDGQPMSASGYRPTQPSI